ncbi:hypothetical protein CVT26_009075 [Gymnopilus dilepis]|uniref:Uncharacterized protein n=1 Tax=Gymnopilus dilepis TaxID=231916 RepID=A0A409YB43_9AGAR|nr:hypothetical protein CVT26_009075 [Gymnopilus dilepis]
MGTNVIGIPPTAATRLLLPSPMDRSSWRCGRKLENWVSTACYVKASLHCAVLRSCPLVSVTFGFVHPVRKGVSFNTSGEDMVHRSPPPLSLSSLLSSVPNSIGFFPTHKGLVFERIAKVAFLSAADVLLWMGNRIRPPSMKNFKAGKF